MIKPIFFICFLIAQLNSLSQEIILSNQRSNRFYIGIDNPLSVMVEGYACRSIILTTDNGTIEKNSCYYSFRPAKTGLAKIQIKIKNGKTFKKIKEVNLSIDSFPSPVAFVGNLHGGTMRKGDLRAQEGVWASAEPSLAFDITYPVVSFTTIIIRNDSIVFSRKTNGNRFEKETTDAFRNLQKDDTVLFTKIVCIGPDGMRRSLRPLEFSIID
jgi:GldM C-terminal domain